MRGILDASLETPHADDEVTRLDMFQNVSPFDDFDDSATLRLNEIGLFNDPVLLGRC
jgi:hypothetical protein